MQYDQEPTIAVGIIDQTDSVTIQLDGVHSTADGQTAESGELQIECRQGLLHCTGALDRQCKSLELTPDDPKNCRFSLEVTIGIDFHWQQKEKQVFRGGLRLIAQSEDRAAVINLVPLETYITSVICSEMNASSPADSIRSHAVISRSWLLAQLDARDAPAPASHEGQLEEGEICRWTEREAHADFDVCADDHCQRYQGVGRIDAPDVAAAIADTRGLVLTYAGRACDARFSKCCGGVVEEYSTAWGDKEVPYLVALADAPNTNLPQPPHPGEQAMRAFVEEPPVAYCNCVDADILNRVLNDYDRTTRDFFRWQVRLDAIEAGALVMEKLGVDLGRLIAMQPIERGPSGRIKRLRLVGETASVVVGKELEIRRGLSPSHLYSSAFVVDVEGPEERPDTFVLSGAGWGHGVGLCQIGAAVMACQGISYREILRHYYPGAELERLYR